MTLWVRPSPQPLNDSPGMLHGMKDGWKWSEKLFWLKIFGKDLLASQILWKQDTARLGIYNDNLMIDLLEGVLC